ncbi:hypothetical protein GE061_017986 [Apolygus lucorum]|uniref:DUF647 domain-containing protein n=1 Tax=Apolygus lucorum TaxID=248454 RepID=A0A8S9XCF8_APOLU|nr:hypothetical protein GE061_017986 [Apolygus lucorum]
MVPSSKIGQDFNLTYLNRPPVITFMRPISHELHVPVLVSESDGNPVNEIVYIKFPDKNEILRLNSSLKPRKKFFKKCSDIVKEVFLPFGYPESVSDDYTEYQIWDTLQACASTITGTLTTKVILQSVGVGNSEASAVGAAVTWILKDGTGMVSRIVFAWLVGSGLDSECKKWRLFADAINDVAMCVELTILPHYSDYALQILCFSTSLKALVGVAGGATRAAITQHQAIHQNMADVSAKDGSQETCVNLITSFMGLGILTLITNVTVMWYVFIVMTLLHLYANYRAVKCLNFTCFNESRLALAIQDYMRIEQVPFPKDVNRRESVFLFGGLNGKRLSAFNISIGHSLGELMSNSSLLPFQLQFLTHLYKDRKYIILINSEKRQLHIGLVKAHKPKDLIEAYFHAVLIGMGSNLLKIPVSQHLGDQIHSKLRQDSILSKLHCIVRTKSQLKLQAQIDLPLIMAIDQFASTYSIKFLADAEMRGWDVTRTLLPVDKWRAEWGEDNKDIDVTKLKTS